VDCQYQLAEIIDNSIDDANFLNHLIEPIPSMGVDNILFGLGFDNKKYHSAFSSALRNWFFTADCDGEAGLIFRDDALLNLVFELSDLTSKSRDKNEISTI
jgi:hypothetical protein